MHIPLLLPPSYAIAPKLNKIQLTWRKGSKRHLKNVIIIIISCLLVPPTHWMDAHSCDMHIRDPGNCCHVACARQKLLLGRPMSRIKVDEISILNIYLNYTVESYRIGMMRDAIS